MASIGRKVVEIYWNGEGHTELLHRHLLGAGRQPQESPFCMSSFYNLPNDMVPLPGVWAESSLGLYISQVGRLPQTAILQHSHVAQLVCHLNASLQRELFYI